LTPLLVIIAVASIALHAEIGPLADAIAPDLGTAITLAIMATITLAQLAVRFYANRRLDRATLLAGVPSLSPRATYRIIRLHDTVIRLSPPLQTATLILGVFCLSLPEFVVTRVPLPPVFATFILLLPLLIALALGWAIGYDMDRRLRESSLVAGLDSGRVYHAMPSRWLWTWTQFRHHLLIVLVPVLLISAWSTLAEPLALSRTVRSVVGSSPLAMDLTTLAFQIAGALCVLALTPSILRRLWDTTPLPAGPLLAGLYDIAAHARVRIRPPLLWRTHGTLMNAMVLGFLPPTRAILMTDLLVESLADTQIRAVMAHEVGHIRRRHLPWLAAVVVVTLGLSTAAADLLLRAIAPGLLAAADPGDPDHALAAGIVTLFSAALTIITFGWVSRRFEWQADAFAAATLSALTPPIIPADSSPFTSPDAAPAPPPSTAAAPVTHITPDGALAITSALRTVALLNHLSPERFSFRHGSIRTRIDRIDSLIGRPIAALPIDRTSRRIKLACIAAGLLLVALLILDIRAASSGRDGSDAPDRRPAPSRDSLLSAAAPYTGRPCLHARPNARPRAGPSPTDRTSPSSPRGTTPS
jgi:Zn-dependent protease with chaperone function